MRWEALLNLEPGGSVVTVWLLRTDGASERRSENRPALERRYSKTKRDPPSRRAGVKRRRVLFSNKNREAWSLFSAKLIIRIIFRPDGSPRPSGTGPIGIVNNRR